MFAYAWNYHLIPVCLEAVINIILDYVADI